MNKFFYNDIVYKNFTLEHWMALFIFAILTSILVFYARKYFSENRKRSVLILLSFLPVISLLLRLMMDSQQRDLTFQEDLPLHLCRILSIAAPIVVFSKNKVALKIFYYLVLAGTFNAMITADIYYGFPHYGYFLYWIYHGTLVSLAIYGILVFEVHLSLKDGLRAFLTVNIYFFIVHMINMYIKSNYMYSRHKPEVESLMDVLGEWPVYIIGLEVIALAMILIIHLVFGRWVIKNQVIKD